MKRIFLTLAITGTLLLGLAFGLGLAVPESYWERPTRLVDWHLLSALGGLLFALLVHAIVLTYFMGTGRWMEETGQAYRLDGRFRAENEAIKYRLIPGMVACMVLLITTGAFGAAIDRASPVGFEGWGGMSGATIHFLLAAATLCLNAVVNFWEFTAIDRNGELVNAVVQEVRRIRQERGLPV